MNIQTPDSLLDAVRNRRCVLFVGAGASSESDAPRASKLARDLAVKFLGGRHAEDNLARVASYVEHTPGIGRSMLIEFILESLSGLTPCHGHECMTEIKWAAIATTNYDTLIEDSYSDWPEHLRPRRIIRTSDLARVAPSEVENKAQSLPLLKLHGCVSDPFADDAKVVISEDDFLDVTKRRQSLLRVLEWLKLTHTFVFVGYSFEDYDLNRVWHDVRSDLGTLERWSFATRPGCSSEEINLWRSRQVELLDCSFSDLMCRLSQHASDEQRPSQDRPSRKERRGVVEALGAITKSVDPREYVLSVQVAELARDVSVSLQMSESEIEDIHDAAFLSTIGKLTIPDSIKYKSGALVDSEFQVVRGHPARAAELLREIPSLKHLASAVLYHHEAINGSGYPDGLTGDTIPFQARIIAVCSAFVSLMSNRPYRKAFPQDEALAILQESAGRIYDERIVQALCDVRSGAEPPPDDQDSSNLGSPI